MLLKLFSFFFWYKCSWEIRNRASNSREDFFKKGAGNETQMLVSEGKKVITLDACVLAGAGRIRTADGWEHL